MKILLLDIETSPNTAYVWGLWNENIPLARLIESSNVLCWSAKWYGQKEIQFDSIFHSTEKTMLKGIHKLLSEADAVVHFNGTRFDIPVLNKEFLLNGMLPPSPYKQVDLYKTAKKAFKFTSNKLDYIASELGVGQKKQTTFELWVQCMKKDPVAWKKMKEYNQHDVVILERVYDKFKGWIANHPNHSLYSGKLCCPNCASTNFKRDGYAYKASGVYQRIGCRDCGFWGATGSTLAKKPSERIRA